MTARTDIANRALLAINGKSSIANIETDQSPEARAIRLVYDDTRDALLRGAHWNFARAVAPAALVRVAPGMEGAPTSAAEWDATTMPMPPWSYGYLLPPDCVNLRYVSGYNPGVMGLQPARHAQSVSRDNQDNEQRIINTNVPGALICYTRRVETVDFWDASFRQAMVYSLATQVALAVTGNLQVAQRMSQMAMQTLQDARVRDGNEDLIQRQRVPDWIAARGDGVDAAPVESVSINGWADPGFLAF